MKKKKIKVITAEEFDAKFDRGDDMTDYMDFEKAVFVRKVNLDFPDWMIQQLDHEAQKLNISRQAIIKMWINDRLNSLPQWRPGHRH